MIVIMKGDRTLRGSSHFPLPIFSNVIKTSLVDIRQYLCTNSSMEYRRRFWYRENLTLKLRLLMKAIFSVLNLNGDEKTEILIYMSYDDGGSDEVREIVGNKALEIRTLSIGCGV